MHTLLVRKYPVDTFLLYPEVKRELLSLSRKENTILTSPRASKHQKKEEPKLNRTIGI